MRTRSWLGYGCCSPAKMRSWASEFAQPSRKKLDSRSSGSLRSRWHELLLAGGSQSRGGIQLRQRRAVVPWHPTAGTFCQIRGPRASSKASIARRNERIRWGQWSCLRFGASQPCFAGEATVFCAARPSACSSAIVTFNQRNFAAGTKGFSCAVILPAMALQQIRSVIP
jgi:hypothetical protein